MPDRVITLTIKLNDADLKRGEISLKNLNVSAQNIGKDGARGLNELESGATSAANAMRELQEWGKAASIGITLFTAGITAAVAAVALLGATIFKLAQGFANYGIEIGKAMDQTGLSAETLSSLRVEAARTGEAFGTVEEALKNFQKKIGDAATGSKKATADLNRLGVDGTKAITNVDGAFRKALETINKLPPGVERTNALIDAFGDQGPKLASLFTKAGGDLDELIKRAEQFGLLLSQDDVRASQEFDRSMNDIQATLRGLGITFGREFLPEVQRVLDAANKSLQQNKNQTTSWAEDSASFVHRLITIFGDFFESIERIRNGGDRLSGTYENIKKGLIVAMPWLIATVKLYQTWANAVSEITSKGHQERALTPFAGGEVNLGAGSYFPPVTATPKAAKIPKLSDEQKQAQELQKIIKDLQLDIQFYGDKTEEAAMKQRLLKMEILPANKALEDQAIALAKNKDAVIEKAKADEKAKKDAEEYRKTLEKSKSSIINTAFNTDADLRAQLESYREQLRIGRDLNDVEQQRHNNVAALVKAQQEWRIAGFNDQDVEVLSSILDDQQKLTIEIIKQVQAEKDRLAADEKRKQHLKDFEDFQKSIQERVDEANRGFRPLSLYEETLKKINEDYSDMPENVKNAVLSQAAWVDSIKEVQAEYEKVRGQLQDIFDYALRGDFKGLGRSILDQARNSLSDKLSGVLATVITGFDPNATNNPVAKPIVKEISGTNKRLDQVIKLLGGSSVPGLGGGLGSILGGLNGGSLGGLGGGIGGGGSAGPATGTQGGSIMDRLKGIFSTNEGGIFAARGGSRTAGIAGGIGDLVNIAGGLVGGRVGGILSSVGTGLSIGAMFGPWGAVIGAGIGLIAGLFQGDPKRKKDKQENIPALNKGFSDAITELNKILDDMRHMTIDPDEAISRAAAVRAEIAGGFGIQFESKKYRKQGQQMISSKLLEADRIISEIKSSAEIARGAADRSKRILPEFAAGTYFADYFRPNGLLPGAFDGRDNILAMISRGEMILNPGQQSRIRGMAGFDVFAGAGIPNYPNPSASPKFAMGGIAGVGGNIVVQPNFTVTLIGMPIGQHIEGYITGDDGKRTLVKVVTKETTAEKR